HVEARRHLEEVGNRLEGNLRGGGLRFRGAGDRLGDRRSGGEHERKNEAGGGGEQKGASLNNRPASTYWGERKKSVKLGYTPARLRIFYRPPRHRGRVRRPQEEVS